MPSETRTRRMKLRRGLKTCGIGFAVLLCALAAFLSYKPPLLDGVSFSQAVYASDGSLMRLSLAKDDTYRLRVPLNRISPLLQQGVLLHEDQRFHEHFGINPASLGRAFMQTYFSGGRRVGASTISMQLARIKFKLHTRSVPGKLWQMLRALQIELHYTKPEILEAYLNLAPYGRNIEGVGAASLIYFGRKAEALTLPEALTLAVIPQSPARRAPRAEDANNAPLIAARNRLFARWKETHPEDVAQSLYFALPLKTRSPEQLPFRAPHTVWSLLKRFPGQSEIVSTIDPRAQNLLENLVGRYVQANRYIGVTNASAMLVDFRSMQVVASVGSADYFNASIFGQVDGTQAKRSPGSALKPFIYALAFEQGLIQPMSLLQDAPASFGEYNPENFDRDFKGPIFARDALMLSRNIPALTLAAQLKKPGLYGFLKQAGVTRLKTEDRYGLSLVLGGAEVSMRELATLYAMLANQGSLRPLRYVKTDPPPADMRLLTPEASFLALDALKNTPRPLKRESGPDVYWKTGTSNAFRDAWTAGVFGPYVLVVWVGDFTGKSNPAFVGVRTAAPLFFQIADALSSTHNLPAVIAQQPKTLNLRQVNICAASGDLADDACPVWVASWFIPGTSPIRKSNIFRNLPVDIKTGQIACRHEPGKTERKRVEFWPSDLRETFRKAGIVKPVPPVAMKECAVQNADMSDGMHPRILSPSPDVTYRVRLSGGNEKIILKASAEADSQALYWYVDNRYIGKESPARSINWSPKPGLFTVRAVDDKGRASSVRVHVAVTE